jgi:hypothetical protein
MNKIRNLFHKVNVGLMWSCEGGLNKDLEGILKIRCALNLKLELRGFFWRGVAMNYNTRKEKIF